MSKNLNELVNDVTQNLLKIVADYKDNGFNGAYSLRQDGQCIDNMSSKNIKITSKTDKPGIIVNVAPGTKNETVYIPSCVSHGGIDDVVYNDFYVGEDCDITIRSGCGVHTDDETLAKHNGIHRFFVGADSKVHYEEKHMGTGMGSGTHSINPVSEIHLDKMLIWRLMRPRSVASIKPGVRLRPL